MSNVYLVSTGSYSDYSVNGVFSTKEKAEHYMRSSGGDDFNDIEEMELDQGFSEWDRGLHLFSMKITKGGNVSDLKKSGYPSLVGPITYWQARKDYQTNTLLDFADQYTSLYVWAEDEAHAIKIANEKRIMALADPAVTTFPRTAVTV